MGSRLCALQPDKLDPGCKMDSKLVFPLTILLLATLIHSGSGQEAEKKKEPLKYYQCNSYEDALCADPFFHDELGQDGEQLAKSGDDFLDECPNDGKEYKFCRKIYQNVRGDERVIRSCGWIPDAKGRTCYSTVLEEYNTEVCACEGDGCNTAATSSISVIAVLSTMALGYLLH